MTLFLTSNKMWFLVYYLPTFSGNVTLFTVFLKASHRNRDNFCGWEYLFSNFKVSLNSKDEECMDLCYVKETHH